MKLRSGKVINGTEFEELCSSIAANNNKEIIEFREKALDDNLVKTLVSTINNCKANIAIDLSYNEITAKGFLLLLNTKINKLFFEYNDLKIKEKTKITDKIINVLSITPHLTLLHLDGSFIDNKIINKIIKNNKSIKNLSLGMNITDEALQDIGDNNTLEILSILETNTVSDLGAKYISENHSLSLFQIFGSNIGDIGADFLSHHPTLRSLTLRDSNISFKGAAVFYDSNLEKVNIYNPNKYQYISFSEIQEFQDNFGHRDLIGEAE